MISVHMRGVGLIARSIGRSCILTDFSWTTPLPFLDIMTGPPSRNELISAIFEVRTFIFGTGHLYPYMDSGFDCPEYLKTLHFDRFFMDHPLQFSRYNDGTADATRVVLAHF